MTFKANQDIGQYSKGDIVPDAQAILWNSMYVDKPCDEVSNESIKENQTVSEVVVPIEVKTEKKVRRKVQ